MALRWLWEALLGLSALCILHFPERGFGWLLPYAWLILQGPAKGGGAPGSIKVIPGACPARVRRDSHESPGHRIGLAWATENSAVCPNTRHFPPAQPERPSSTPPS